MLNAKLIVVGGDAKASEVQLRLPTVIGRGRDVSLTLPHPLVSRRHTEIFEREGQLFVRDLGSLNGTFVNNQRIEDEQPLEPNQLLTLGNVTFRAVYEVGGSTTDAQPENAAEQTVPLAPGVVESSARKKTESSSAAEQARAAEKMDPMTVPIEPVQSSSSSVLAGGEASQVLINSLDDSDSERSVSASAIDELPSAISALSFSGDLDIEGAGAEDSSVIDPAALELDGQPQNQQVEADNSGLGSFLKKLPR